MNSLKICLFLGFLFLLLDFSNTYRTTPFFDDFSGSELNRKEWLISYRQWGGAGANGGVHPDLVHVSNGLLRLEAHGDLYEGPLNGINKDYSPRPHGKRVGATIATRDYFASASYEVRMKVLPHKGACSTMWTFHYEEYYPEDPAFKNKPVGGEDYYAVNHEIDIEIPGRRSGKDYSSVSFNHMLLNTFIGENDDEYTTEFYEDQVNHADGQFHTYKFDLHTGSATQEKRVEFFVDGVHKHTTFTHVPSNAMRFWLGVWFPRDWAGVPNFDTDFFEVDWVKITPFLETGDRWFPESFDDGWSDSYSEPRQKVFYEDFSSNSLDPSKWKIAKKNWGGQLGKKTASWNGGVNPQNVAVRNGRCILEMHGDYYEGQPLGINKDNSIRRDGKRVGAAIATTDYFASGKYEVRMKIAPQMGVCTSMWTFSYFETYPDDPEYQNKPVGGEDYYALNHEIDIEFPGRPGPKFIDMTYKRALLNTFVGENDDESNIIFKDVGKAQNDGKFHTYRFDWHTSIPRRVDFYIDGVYQDTSTNNVPFYASRLWIAGWFPRDWAGVPNFNVSKVEIDWVRITPFNEDGDVARRESFPDDGWASYAEYPQQTKPVASSYYSEEDEEDNDHPQNEHLKENKSFLSNTAILTVLVFDGVITTGLIAFGIVFFLKRRKQKPENNNSDIAVIGLQMS